MRLTGDATPSAGDSTEPYDDPPTKAPISRADAITPDGDPSRYVVLDEHGRGGIGRVLRARDGVLGRTVAIKELLNPSDHGEARFLREARITARLEHPAVVPVHDAGRWPDSRRPFYAMKLVSGRSLRELVEAASGLDQRIALVPNVVAVAEAVAYAHSQRIIHRDLKPSNVIVGAYGETVVIDWGLAKDLAEVEPHQVDASPYRANAAPELTAEGAILGTPVFMPPEQAHGAEVDERADVYSLGAMLYFVLSGQAPYGGERASLLLAEIRTQSPVPLRQREPRVPPDLAAIVDKAMAWDASGRYRDAGELAADLRRFTTGQLVGAHDYSRRQLVARWIRRNRALTALTAAFTLAAVLGAAWFLSREQGLRRDAEIARDRAEVERRRADGQTIALLEQNGRRELDLGRPFRAAVYLAEAYRRAPSSAVIRSLVTQAVEPLDAHRFELLGHEGNVIALAWSRDGAVIASGASDRTVRVWDARTGKSLRVLEGHTAWLEDVAFSPDGARLASVAGAETIVWDAATGAELRRFKGGFRAAFSLDGERLAVGGNKGELRVWDLATGKPVLDEVPYLLRVGAVVFHPDGKRVFTGSWDGRMTISDAATWKPIVQIPPITGQVVEAAFSSDGEWLLTCDEDVTLQIRRAETGEVVHEIVQPSGSRIKNAWFSGEGRLIVTTSADGVIRVWHTRSGALLRSLDVVPHGKLFDAALSPDGASIVTGDYDGAGVWDVSDPTRALAGGERGNYDSSGIYPGVYTGDGTRFVAGYSRDSGGHEIRVWNARTGELTASWPSVVDPLALVTNADGTRVLAVDAEGEPSRLWDGTGRLVALVEGHEGRVEAVAATRDGSLIATAGKDKTIRLWRSEDGRPVGKVIELDQRPTAVAFSPDGSRLGVADRDGQVAVLRRDDGARILFFRAHPTYIQDIEFSRDGKLLVTAGRQDHTAITWDAQTGAKRRELVGHTDNLTRASFGPDGTVVATASVDDTARVWDERTGQLLRVVRGAVYNAAIADDGAHLFTTGEKELAVIWNIGQDPRTPDQIAAFVADKSPWRLRDGRLELARPAR